MDQISSKDPGGQTANKRSVDEIVCKESTYQNSRKVSTDQTASKKLPDQTASKKYILLDGEKRNQQSDC